jgi:hypothetical protein
MYHTRRSPAGAGSDFGGSSIRVDTPQTWIQKLIQNIGSTISKAISDTYGIVPETFGVAQDLVAEGSRLCVSIEHMRDAILCSGTSDTLARHSLIAMLDVLDDRC